MTKVLDDAVAEVENLRDQLAELKSKLGPNWGHVAVETICAFWKGRDDPEEWRRAYEAAAVLEERARCDRKWGGTELDASFVRRVAGIPKQTASRYAKAVSNLWREPDVRSAILIGGGIDKIARSKPRRAKRKDRPVSSEQVTASAAKPEKSAAFPRKFR